MSAVGDLPSDLLCSIAGFLDSDDLEEFKLVSKKFQEASVYVEDAVYDRTMRMRNMKRLESQYMTMGYVDGLEVHKEERLQEGFDSGFLEASRPAFTEGYARGVLAALSLFLDPVAVADAKYQGTPTLAATSKCPSDLAQGLLLENERINVKHATTLWKSDSSSTEKKSSGPAATAEIDVSQVRAMCEAVGSSLELADLFQTSDELVLHEPSDLPPEEDSHPSPTSMDDFM